MFEPGEVDYFVLLDLSSKWGFLIISKKRTRWKDKQNPIKWQNNDSNKNYSGNQESKVRILCWLCLL